MNTEASARTRAIVLPIMSRWLEENPADAKRVADLAVSAMRTRTKSNAEQQAARALLSKGSKSRNGLPPKLRDCTGKSDRPKELLIVEATAPAARRSMPVTRRSRPSSRCAASR